MAKIKRFPLGTFMKQFSTEARCQEYLADLRWQSGYVCPKCGCRHAYRLANGRYQCAKCRYQVSVTAGTVLHKTHNTTDAVVSGVLFCMPGQAGHLSRSAGGNDLQNRVVHAQTHSCCYGAAG